MSWDRDNPYEFKWDGERSVYCPGRSCPNHGGMTHTFAEYKYKTCDFKRCHFGLYRLSENHVWNGYHYCDRCDYAVCNERPCLRDGKIPLKRV